MVDCRGLVQLLRGVGEMDGVPRVDGALHGVPLIQDWVKVLSKFHVVNEEHLLFDFHCIFLYFAKNAKC